MYDETAIMVSAAEGRIEITKYLYDRGARLETSTRHVYKRASKKTLKLLMKWENDKKSDLLDTLERLKLEKKMKRLLIL